jgi:hypothetical protein
MGGWVQSIPEKDSNMSGSSSLLAEPLYKTKKGSKREPLTWESKQQQAFHAIKEALVSAPALGFQDMKKPFFLYVLKRSGMAIGVPTQYLGSWYWPMAYLSKQVDSVAKA